MERYLDVLYIMVLTVLVSCIIAYIFFQRRKRKKVFDESQDLLLQQNLLQEYQAAVQEQMDMARKLRHDIANHMETMEELVKRYGEDEKVFQYMDSLREKYKGLERIHYCKDPILDSVIYNKMKICIEAGIETNIRMNFFEKGSIQEIDMLKLLYHLFNHAIEGCCQMEKGERFIELSGGCVAGHMILKMCSSMKVVEEKKGYFLTLKKNREMSGIDMTVIEEFARKYHGEVMVKIVDGMLETTVSAEIQTDTKNTGKERRISDDKNRSV
ncbi:MAG: GHKL domain-containing protein [Lachnospiraceae bacterium]|nr:GHKL domain-containing protein [Lachnospiraceae bacterium]